MHLALALLTGVSAETILGSYIFQRHGDRLQKPTVYLTPIGTRQCQESGQFYQSRYFSQFDIDGLDAVYNASQFTIDTPSSDVLWKSMLAWTQGFYPTLDENNVAQVQGAQMSNDSVETTAGQLQYVFIDATDELSDNYWKVKGGDGCSLVSEASESYYDTDAFKALNSSTFDFYQSLQQYVGDDIKSTKLNFGNAYTVFDHFLTQDVHNETFHDLIGGQDSDVFVQIRTLQDQYTRGLNVNPDKSAVQLSGATVLSQVLDFMTQLGSEEHPVRVKVLGGSYDQFYQVFQLLNWYNVDDARFTGIVNYGASIAFEVYQEDGSDSPMVRVGIRNGTSVTETDVTLDFYPVYGNSDNGIALDQFTDKITNYTTSSWCNACGSDEAAICSVYNLKATMASKHLSDLSPAAYGGIGAGVTLGVLLLAGGAIASLMVMTRRRRSNRTLDGEASMVQSESTAMASLKQ